MFALNAKHITAVEDSFGTLGTAYHHLHTSIDADVIKQASDDLHRVGERRGIPNFPEVIQEYVDYFAAEHQNRRLEYMHTNTEL